MFLPRRLLQEHVDTLDELRKKAAAHDYFQQANANLKEAMTEQRAKNIESMSKILGRYKELQRQLSLAQSANETLRGKLVRRSRELGIQRAEVKKIDAMYCQAAEESEELHARDAKILEECKEAYGRLAHQVDVLHRLTRVHFSEDEIAAAMDSDAAAFAVVRGLPVPT